MKRLLSSFDPLPPRRETEDREDRKERPTHSQHLIKSSRSLRPSVTNPTFESSSVETFDAQQDRIRILEGIARGERAVQEGRTLDHAQAQQRLKRWLA